MGQNKNENNSMSSISNTSSKDNHREDSPIPVRSKAPVPVWKTPSKHDKNNLKKPAPRPVPSDLDKTPANKSSVMRVDAYEMSPLEEEEEDIHDTYEPVENVRIIKEKVVRHNYIARFFSFFRRFVPESVSDAKLRTFNLILACIAFMLIIIIFIAVVLN